MVYCIEAPTRNWETSRNAKYCGSQSVRAAKPLCGTIVDTYWDERHSASGYYKISVFGSMELPSSHDEKNGKGLTKSEAKFGSSYLILAGRARAFGSFLRAVVISLQSRKRKDLGPG